MEEALCCGEQGEIEEGLQRTRSAESRGGGAAFDDAEGMVYAKERTWARR